MTVGRQHLGRRGERLAEQALRDAGLCILERRFRTRYGEIDLIAEQGVQLVFVEVKTRRGAGFGRPAEAVTATKRRRLARVAASYLQRHDHDGRPCRFDVVQVHLRPDEPARIEHIVDAFRLWYSG